jgi:tRNA pseudouridine55 synthase
VKVGHTGTLDPAATGLLLLCLGKATVLAQFLSGWNKEYVGDITLGAVSDTMDGDGRITAGGAVPEMTRDQVETLVKDFKGEIVQKVPAYAAVRKNGKKLYEYARKGETVDTPTRQVTIHSFEVVDWDSPRLTVRVRCSKGTYIRALASEIGDKAGCGAYLSALRRTAVGPYALERALTLEQVREAAKNDNLIRHVVSMNDILQFPRVYLPAEAAGAVKHGACPGPDDIVNWQGDFKAGDLVSFVTVDGNLLAVGRSHRNAADLHQGNSKEAFSFVRVVV